MSKPKHLGVWPSLRYGWRLTWKHWKTLVPGTVVFYLPELLARLGLALEGWAWLVTLFKSAVGCWLLWHAIQLSDQETRSSRLPKSTRPAPGYLWRFIASTLLFWGGLVALLALPVALLSPTWIPDRQGLNALLHVCQPWTWDLQNPHGDWLLLLALPRILLACLPAGLWSVYGWFHGYYVADEGQGAWQSMVSSYRSVKGVFWRTTGFLLVIAAVNALGLALWFAGIFIAFPVALMATTYVHLELKLQSAKAPRGRKRR